MDKDREKFDSQWRTSPFKVRGFKFLGENDKEVVAKVSHYQERLKVAVNDIIEKIFVLLQEGKVQKGELNLSFAARYTKLNEDYLANTYGFGIYKVRSSVVQKAIQVLKSRLRRFKEKFPKVAPRLRNNDSMFLIQSVLLDRSRKQQRGKLRIRLAEDNYFEAAYRIPDAMFRNKPHLPRYFGGNLVRSEKSWHFAACVKVPYSWLFDPIGGPISFDLNLKDEDFLTFSDGSVIVPTPEITRLVARLKLLNEEVKDKARCRRSSQRRAVRRKIQRVHQRLFLACKPLCDQILDKVVAGKMLLCLDGLSCGAKTGSFGQDKVIPYLIHQCEERRIPYVVVPTPFTSLVHHECQTLAFRDKNTDRCWCENPVHEEQVFYNAHQNAALNIASWGWMIWKEGIQAHRAYLKPFRKENKRREEEKPTKKRKSKKVP